MSISTPSGEQKSPSSVKVSGKPSAKPSGKPSAATGKAKAAGGSPRKPFTPVKVNQGRPWGPIALFGAVGLLSVLIIGWAAWAVWGPSGSGRSWESRAGNISGIQDLRSNNYTALHFWEPQTYKDAPPVGGNHSNVWQQCSGNIYTAPIPNEHAVHSLEHGAVWLTYRSDLPSDQVATLASKVKGKNFAMMSPVDGLSTPVSIQAWGWQLKVDNVNDSRIDAFITALAKNATAEKGAVCSGGNTATGTTALTEEQAKAKGLWQ